MTDFQNKSVLVTGGAGGIGLAIAREFAGLGAQLIVLDRDPTALEKLRCESDYQCILADVTEPEECATKIGVAVKENDGIDILVNNAGIFERKSNDRVRVADWTRILNANLLTPFFACEAVAESMKAGGSIICISSVAAFYARPDQAAYCTSKTALEQLVRVLALDLARGGIRVNAVRPGIVESEMVRESIHKNGGRPVNIPLGRFGSPEDVAECVSFLARARHITGQVLTVDGGQTLQFVDPFA